MTSISLMIVVVMQPYITPFVNIRNGLVFSFTLGHVILTLGATFQASHISHQPYFLLLLLVWIILTIGIFSAKLRRRFCPQQQAMAGEQEAGAPATAGYTGKIEAQLAHEIASGELDGEEGGTDAPASGVAVVEVAESQAPRVVDREDSLGQPGIEMLRLHYARGSVSGNGAAGGPPSATLPVSPAGVLSPSGAVGASSMASPTGSGMGDVGSPMASPSVVHEDAMRSPARAQPASASDASPVHMRIVSPSAGVESAASPAAASAAAPSASSPPAASSPGGAAPAPSSPQHARQPQPPPHLASMSAGVTRDSAIRVQMGNGEGGADDEDEPAFHE